MLRGAEVVRTFDVGRCDAGNLQVFSNKIMVQPEGKVGCECVGVSRDNKGGRQRVGGEVGETAGLGGERHVVGGEFNTLFFCLCASEYQPHANAIRLISILAYAIPHL